MFSFEKDSWKIISKNNRAYANFIDLSKAFNLVNHKILLKKLENFKVPKDIIKILSSYLKFQSARIKFRGHIGEFHDITRGVRQGGILSPILFKLYIDSLINDISSMDIGCKLGISCINILTYADDIVLLSNSAETLNKKYIKFETNIMNLKLKINANKSKIIYLHFG